MDIEREVEDLMEFVLWAFEAIHPRSIPHEEETQKRLAFVKKALRQTLEQKHKGHKPDNVTGPHDILLSWKPEYATGNVIIDEQHQSLVRAANEFFRAMLTNPPKSAIEPLMRSLIVEIATHFETEEGLMDTQHPGGAEHAFKHKVLLHKAYKLFSSYQDGHIGLGVLLDFVITDLILNHVAREERLFQTTIGL